MSLVLFYLVYIGLLVLPGLAIVRVFNLSYNGFLSTISISYAVFTLSFITSNYFSLSSEKFTAWLFSILALSTLYVLFNRFSRDQKEARENFPACFTIILLSAFYQLVFGSYTEVPADLYAHLERYQYAYSNVLDDTLGRPLSANSLLLQGSGVFYYLVAFSNSYAGLTADALVPNIDFINRTLFLVAIYFFSKEVFQERTQRVVISLLAVLFVSLHFGVTVFSYIRYYTLAPTILNMILYFFGAIVVLDLVKRKLDKTCIPPYLVLTLLMVSLMAIHVQEGIYLGVMIACIAFASLTLSTFANKHTSDVGMLTSNYHAGTITTLCIVAFAVVYVYSQYNLTRAPNAHWRLWDFGEGLGFIPRLTVLNLKFQFMEVMTLWGLFVYFLVIVNFKRYRNNLFLVAAMASPFVTFLNPFFVDLFVRHYNSTTLWRFCFLLPVHFVAADLFVHYCSRIKQDGLVTKLISAIFVIPLIALLFPIKGIPEGLHFSRLPTLGTLQKNVGYKHHQDLIDFLNSIEKKHKIITDPMTGYMVSGLSHHYSERKKFHRNAKFIRFTYREYSQRPLQKHKGSLVIVNQRNHSLSQIGEQSGHWRPNEWRETSHYYTPALTAHLSDEPSLYETLWSTNDIQVYRIK